MNAMEWYEKGAAEEIATTSMESIVALYEYSMDVEADAEEINLL